MTLLEAVEAVRAGKRIGWSSDTSSCPPDEAVWEEMGWLEWKNTGDPVVVDSSFLDGWTLLEAQDESRINH